jgi:hypothetical protein
MVTSQKFTFEGLNPIEKHILRIADECGYITVLDRSDHRKEEPLGRIDLTMEGTAPYREEDEGASVGLSDAMDEEPADAWEDDEGFADEQPDEPEPQEPLPMRVLAAAGCKWLRDIAERNTIGECWRRFRVRVYAPKANRLLYSGQFVCRNHSVDLEIPPDDALPDLQMPQPSFEQATTVASAKGIRALGDFYSQWGHIVLGSVSQLQGVNNSMLARLHRQLQESRDQVEQLLAALLEFRFKEMEAEHQRDADQQAGDTRTVLAREAINQLGSAAQAFLASKGVTPDMADLLGTLSQSQDLMAALQDPGVRKLMQDPSNLSGLATMLKQAAQAAGAAEADPAAAGQPSQAEGQDQAPAAG